jgi:hypothetical protein
MPISAKSEPRVVAIMAQDEQLPMVRDVLAALGLAGSVSAAVQGETEPSYSQPLSSATRTASARVCASSLPIADDR